MRIFFGLLILVSIGCSTNTIENNEPDVSNTRDLASIDPKPQSLIVSTDWLHIAPENDPFNPPNDATCDETATGANELDGEPTYEIQTDGCPWGTMRQTSKVAVKKDDPVNVRIWHFALVGDTPATIRVRLDDWNLVELSIPQPADAQLIAETFTAPRDFELGTDVYFHVHNHGANEYSMIELSVGNGF